MNDADVLSCSSGEVINPSTYDHRTLKPERGGLFCEAIFGPVRDWECACGKYKTVRYEGIVCERCGVEVTPSDGRRKRMGHIELPVPVVHPWYLQGPGVALLAAALNLTDEHLREIVAHSRAVVVDSGSARLRTSELLDLDGSPVGRPDDHETRMTGAEGVEVLLREAITQSSKLPLDGIVIRRLPVLPPALRPCGQLSDATWFTDDVNELYRAVVHRTNRMRRLKALDAADLIVQNDGRLLQEDVGPLFDNARQVEPAHGSSRTRLHSLADHLIRCNQAFRQRSIDYSASTRLVVGDTPAVDTTLLPSRLAWDIFQPTLINAVITMEIAAKIGPAVMLVKSRALEALPALNAVCADALILVSLPAARWRLFAMHVALSGEMALQVRSEVLDHVGWEHVGGRVRVFSVLTREASAESARLLTPSQLRGTVPIGSSSGDEEPQGSVFDLTAADQLSEAALTNRSFRLTARDHLLLCDADSLTVQ